MISDDLWMTRDMNRQELTWIDMNRIEKTWIWIILDRRSNQIELNWTESKGIEKNQIKSNWRKLKQIKSDILNCIELDQIDDKLI